MNYTKSNNARLALANHAANVKDLERKVSGYDKIYKAYREFADNTSIAQILESMNYRLVESKGGFNEIRVGTGEHVTYAFNAFAAMNGILKVKAYVLNKLDHVRKFNPSLYVPNTRTVFDPSNQRHWFFSWNKTGFVPSVLNDDQDKLSEDQQNHVKRAVALHRELETYREAMEKGDSFGIVLFDEKMIAHWNKKLTHLESTLSEYLKAMAEEGEEERELEKLDKLPKTYEPARKVTPANKSVIDEAQEKLANKEKFSIKLENKSGKPLFKNVSDLDTLNAAIRVIKAAAVTVKVSIDAFQS